MNKIMFFCIWMLLNVVSSSNTIAQERAGNIAIQIPSVHYHHPVRLLHPYLDLWHLKGPLAEKAAFTVFSKRFNDLKLCKDNKTAAVVLLIEPQLFYNAQMNVFHAQIIARAYTNSIEPILSIKKEAQQIGYLTINPDFYIEKAYLKAMEEVAAEIETDPNFLAALNPAQKKTESSFCTTLDHLPPSSFYY